MPLSERREQACLDYACGTATVLISNCSGQTVGELDSYLQNVTAHPQHGIQGYELVTDGGIGTIAAFGLAAHSRNQDPVFSGIPFTDPAMVHAANSIFAGVPFGTQQALPDGVYKPRISFTNFSASPAHVTVSIATTPPGVPSNASATAASPEKRVLQQLTLAPRRTAEFALSDPGSQSGLQQSLIIETDRKPGEVLGKVVSRSDGNLYEIELLGKDQMDEDNGGSHPWSVEGDSISHLLLFNYSDKPRVFGVGVSNGAIVWDKKYTLAPRETREISINELIDDKVADDQGQVLSPDRTRGVVNWMVPDSGEGTGRLMVTSRSRALARNFSCGQFIVVCGMTFLVSGNGFLDVNDTLALYTADPQFCDEFSPDQCTGGSDVSSGSANYSWSVGASNIVTTSSPNISSPPLYGVGPGTGYADVTVTAGGCQSGGSGDPTVQVPTSLKLVKAPPTILQQGTGLQHGCAPGFYGIMIDVDYQVLDQNGAPVASAKMEPQELLSGETVYHDIGGSQADYPQSAKFTRADGTFDDVPVGFCKNIPFNTPVTETQDIQILLNGSAYHVRTNNYSFSSTNLPNQGTITNGKDINATQ